MRISDWSSDVCSSDLVRSLFLFNVTSQYWMSYTPGAPAWLNQAFADHLDSGAIVWVSRSPQDSRGGITWQPPTKVSTVTRAQALPVPPAGRVTAGVAGTTSVPELVQAQPFQVEAVFAFDVAQQRYVSHTPGAAGRVQSLPVNGLNPPHPGWGHRNA